MVLPLYVVSLFLVAGGGAAALYGADTIRTETGATLAVAGVAMACAGLLMFALTACLAELRRIRRLVEAGEGLASRAPFPVPVTPGAPASLAPAAAAAAAVAIAAAEALPPASPPEPAPPPPPPEPLPVTLPVTMPEPKPEAPETVDLAPALRETERVLGRNDEVDGFGWEPERPAHGPDSAPADEAPQGEPEAPHAEPAAAQREDVEPAPHSVEEPAPAPELQPDGPDEADRGPDHEEPSAGPAMETLVLETPAERKLVATYTSGENTYFMYSDNAIEAETPHGRFRFASMDELRVFVETGEGGMPLSPAAPPGA
jgi:hypothetical protein